MVKRKHTVLSSNLGLRNDELKRVAVIGLIDRVVQNADCLQQMTNNLGLLGEVRRVGNDLLGLGGEGESLTRLASFFHSSLDTRHLTILIQDLIDVCVQHVSSTVDGGQTSKALRELTQSVKRVNVGRLSVASHGIHIQSNTVDGLSGLPGFGDVIVRLVQSHGVSDKVTGGSLERELIVYILHGASGHVES